MSAKLLIKNKYNHKLDKKSSQNLFVCSNMFSHFLLFEFKATSFLKKNIITQKRRLMDAGRHGRTDRFHERLAECNVTVPGLKRFIHFPFDMLTTLLITVVWRKEDKDKSCISFGNTAERSKH